MGILLEGDYCFTKILFQEKKLQTSGFLGANSPQLSLN